MLMLSVTLPTASSLRLEVPDGGGAMAAVTPARPTAAPALVPSPARWFAPGRLGRPPPVRRAPKPPLRTPPFPPRRAAQEAESPGGHDLRGAASVGEGGVEEQGRRGGGGGGEGGLQPGGGGGRLLPPKGGGAQGGGGKAPPVPLRHIGAGPGTWRSW